MNLFKSPLYKQHGKNEDSDFIGYITVPVWPLQRESVAVRTRVRTKLTTAIAQCPDQNGVD